MNWLKLITLLLGFTSSYLNGQSSINLTGEWEFANEKKLNWKPAKVPGLVHLDLLANKQIEPPYEGLNEQKLSWIENENWIYRKSFTINQEQFSRQHIDLVFGGLDTYAIIRINDYTIDSTDNMFRRWRFDIKPYLNLGENKIEILFQSPVNKHKTTIENAAFQLPSANENVAVKVSPYTRKAAYHFGWDWGPRFVSMGIWKPCLIEFWDDVRFIDYSYQTSIHQKEATALVTFEVLSDSIQTLEVQIQDSTFNVYTEKGLNTFHYELIFDTVKLWNPINRGEQHRYKIPFEIRNQEKKLYNSTLKIALRKVELINQKDEFGTSFYFKINDTPLFIKGANYIPQDLFVPRVDSASYENLIKQVANANINLLRVWGGGIYESDYFYDLCDHYGILVWQDFMFANSMYPNDTNFISTVKWEVEDNIRRLRNHPSIVIWCGNNEIQVAWDNWGWQKQFNYTKNQEKEIYSTYKSIFHQLIPNTLKELDPQRPYTSTSPLSNWGTRENFNHGTMHYWGVWHGRDSLEAYKNNVGRFMVEYGFQSYPNIESLKKTIDSSQLYLNSPTLLNRQKSYVGNELIEKNINRYMIPSSNFSDWILQSQKIQSYALKTAIEAHRFGTPHCMGTVFWQLNDCWPGPSWSIIDYYGNPKSSYETVRNNYASTIAKINIEEDILTIQLINDNQEIDTCQVVIDLFSSKNCSAVLDRSEIILNPLEEKELYFHLPKTYLKKHFKHGELTRIQASIFKGDNQIHTKVYNIPVNQQKN
ncbi:glycoside hydrolase family 2 protein [Crocinitomix algicola]|uniref:glycoside hydrolase family 2 protein n=1 Tax=Crocinitomix algicola TaxID=1740263 RepID=UPI000872ED4D|nr:glycoside hydrolase family 2 TIM barrel-domain containing protein [Crocinitomix algicola]